MLRPPRTPLSIVAAVGATLSLTLVVAGCGGGSKVSLEGCLNGKGFLVQGDERVVRGSSEGGVNFTLTVYSDPAAAKRAIAGRSPKGTALIGNAVADFTGNPPPHPGGAPGKLSKAALATIRSCLPQQ